MKKNLRAYGIALLALLLLLLFTMPVAAAENNLLANGGFEQVDANGNLTSYMADVDTDAAYTADTEVIKDGYFHESEIISAPLLDFVIDGITELN